MNSPKPDPGNVNCVGCSRLNVGGCQECRRCKDECGCICKGCQNCGTKHHPKYFCKVCRKCRRFNSQTNQPECQCRTAPSFHRRPIEDGGSIYNDLRRKLGLEIECSYIGRQGGLRLPKFVEAQWVHDGSVTAGGLEMVVSPLFGDDFIRGVAHISEELNLFNFKVDESCGFHVHVGAEDFSPFSMRRLILLYHKYEDLFYHLVAPGRDLPREVRGEVKYYAKRWNAEAPFYQQLAALTKSHDIRIFILRWLYGSRSTRHMVSNGFNWGKRGDIVNYNAWADLRDIRSHKYEKARYFGLNLHTWFQRQTVEYRHHEGTISPSKLMMWPLFCGWFTELASALRDKEIAQLATVKDLVYGKWKRKYHVVEMPEQVADWVVETLKERKVEVV